MPGSKWRYVMTNMEGTPVGEVKDAYERKYTANLSKPSTASFQVRKDNDILPYLFAEYEPTNTLPEAGSSKEGENYLLQVWQDNTIRFWGPIVTANLAMTEGQAPTVAVTAVDPAWRLGRRFYWGTGVGFANGPNDKALLAQGLIGVQNVRSEGFEIAFTGISGNSDKCGSTGSYTIPTGKSCLQGIQELAQGLDGFDWYIEPRPAAVPIGNAVYMPSIGVFRAGAIVGSAKASVFEFGVGAKNMRSINFLKDQTTRANSALNLSEEGFETTALNTNPLVAKIANPSWERFGLYETMAELSGVPSVTLREQYTQEVINVRRNARQILSMTSDFYDGTARVPQFGHDYWLGDTVTARGVVGDTTVFNGAVRVYSVEVSINNAGTVTYTPILVQEAE